MNIKVLESKLLKFEKLLIIYTFKKTASEGRVWDNNKLGDNKRKLNFHLNVKTIIDIFNYFLQLFLCCAYSSVEGK